MKLGNALQRKGRLLMGVSALALAAIVLAGCERGSYAVDIFPEMHYQQSNKLGEPPRMDKPAGAVPVTGINTHRVDPAVGAALTNPLPNNAATIAQGAEKYRVNCAMCHGPAAKGDGAVGRILVRDGYLAPPNLTASFTQGKTDGEIYTAITNGVNVMPTFGYLLTDNDRWAIIAYLRSLPKS